MKKYLVLGLAALLLTAVVGPETALAGGRGNGARGGDSSAITLDQVEPSFGGQVSFTVTTTLEDPWVNARCYQAGDLVYSQWRRTYDGSHTETFTLGPTPSWTSGGASCVAEVVKLGNKDRVVGAASFDVAP